MSITKKHFKAVAEIINNHVFNYSVEDDVFLNDNKRKLVNSFIKYFKTQNKNFDSIKFYNACFNIDKVKKEYNNNFKLTNNKEMQ